MPTEKGISVYAISANAANGDLVVLLIMCQNETGWCGRAYVDRVFKPAEIPDRP